MRRRRRVNIRGFGDPPSQTSSTDREWAQAEREGRLIREVYFAGRSRPPPEKQCACCRDLISTAWRQKLARREIPLPDGPVAVDAEP